MKGIFRGIRPRDNPAEEYDAIIIGAGIGGLICANLLAKAGLRVLVAEQHYVVGGYCSSFSRKGFKFDAASHFYPLLGNPSTITGQLLQNLGIATEWIKMDPVDHFHFPDGSRYSVPADFERYLTEVKERFPEERVKLDTFFKEVRFVHGLGLLAYFRGRTISRLAAYESESLQSALDRHFTNPKLKLLLTADCPHWGAPPSRISYVFDSMLRLSYFLGNYYPKGGSQAFADALAWAIEGQGSEVMLQAQAREIRVEKGAVQGVEFEVGPPRDRRRIFVRSRRVISNADLKQTCERLLDRRHVAPELLSELRQLRCSFPCYLMHLGIRDATPEEFQEAQGYHWDGWDPNLVGESSLRFKFFLPTQFDPDIAPPGSQIIIIQKVIDMAYDKIADWGQHKAKIDAYVLDRLAQLVPRLEERTVLRLSASAHTSHRFTLNQSGAMLGWEMSPDQLGVKRPDFAANIEGLYYTGHWTRPGGGITPVIVSAMRTAEAITANTFS